MKLAEILEIRRKDKEQSDFIWNMVGNICFAMMSILLLIFVTNIAGKEMGGVFSFAFSTSQLLSTIGVFGVRQFQVTDITQRYSFTDYFLLRIVTTFLMIICGVIAAVCSGNEAGKMAVVLLLCLYRIGESLGTCVEDEFQKDGKLYVSGKLLTLRVVLPSIAFVIILLITKNIILSSAAYMLSALALFFLCCAGFIKERFVIKEMSACSVLKIAVCCIPLFISVFAATYIVNVPKYLLDGIGGSQIQIIYSIIAMPTFAVNLLSEFFSKPYMVPLSIFWKNKDLKPFLHRVIKILITMTCITIGIVLGGYAIGLKFLSFIYSVPEILCYDKEFILLLIGAGFNAGALFFNSLLIVFRKQKMILGAYLLTGIATLLFGTYFIRVYLVAGAVWTFFFSSLLLFIIFIIMFIFYLLKEKVHNTSKT